MTRPAARDFDDLIFGYQPPADTEKYPIIVHSHLRWDWVWQRPQQFLSRLSARHPVLYMQCLPPSPDLKSPSLRVDRIKDFDVTILEFQFPQTTADDREKLDREWRRITQALLAGPLKGRFESPVQWFYDPMAVRAFKDHLNARAIVYDCMDELSQFRHAPPEIVRREQELLAAADVVFTGGRKLWESKKRFNDNCHFYGCGVDVNHFSRARSPDLHSPADVAAMEKPILGYFGVVDERLDYELLEKLASKNPGWNIVMVGPMTKVEPDALPKRPNLHWLGGRTYDELPAYAKAFDVCMMPFALNEATEYINPTKALEYMATGTPIVSTAVADVIANFGDVVHVAKSSSEFIAECARCVQNPDRERIQRGVEMARNNTWEKIVRSLEGHIHDVLEEKARQARLEDDVMTVESSIATKTLLSVQGQTGEVEYV